VAVSALNPGYVRALKGLAHLTALLVFLQAVLAGLFTSREELGARDLHEVMANALFMVVLAELAAALLVRGASQYRLHYLVAVLAAAIAGQIGLGYAGREETLASAVHVPLGVLIFGLAVVVSVLASLDDFSGPGRTSAQ
jgi:hypothetical protein